jgi:hypothetical protein
VVFRALPDSRVERVIIETGVHHDGMVEVTKGLRAGELVVSRGQAWLTDGQGVVLRHADGTLATRAPTGPPLPDVAGSGDEPVNVP